MDRAEVAQQVAERLVAAENAIDEAVRTGAELLARLSHARRELDLSAVVGGEVFSRSAAALTAITAARAETAACHDALARLQVRVGVRPTATGAGEKPPPVEATACVAAFDASARRRA